MNEKFVKNIVMNEEIVKNSVINAKIDSKVVIDLSIFRLLDRTIYSLATNVHWETIGIRITVVVNRNSKQRSIPCDTVLGTTLCEFRSAHEEIDVTL